MAAGTASVGLGHLDTEVTDAPGRSRFRRLVALAIEAYRDTGPALMHELPRRAPGAWREIRHQRDELVHRQLERVVAGSAHRWPASAVVRAAAGAIATVTGEPRLAAEAFGYARDIVTRLPPLAPLLILLVFRWRIGSARATLLSLVPAVVAAALTMGGLGWTIGSVSLVTALVPFFVIVLGSADGLHLTSHVLDRLRSGDPRLGAVTETLRAVGAPIATTTATTMAGFLSLTVIDSAAIRQLGIAAASGVFVAGAASFFVLPTLLLAVPLRASVRGARHAPSRRRRRRLRGDAGARERPRTCDRLLRHGPVPTADPRDARHLDVGDDAGERAPQSDAATDDPYPRHRARPHQRRGSPACP